MTRPTVFSDIVLCACGCGEGAPIATASHAARGRVKGEPMPFRRGHQAKTRTATPASDRFWSQVEGSGVEKCWPWRGYRRRGGYGLFNVSRTRWAVAAHRFAYEDLIGPIPEGLDIDHLCRNPSCVNPWHMEPVPRAVNVARANTNRSTTTQEIPR